MELEEIIQRSKARPEIYAPALAMEALRLRAERDQLRAELAECKQDAERYRWLRHPRIGWDIVHKTEVGLVCAEYLACVELDAAIDAARKGEGEK